MSAPVPPAAWSPARAPAASRRRRWPWIAGAIFVAAVVAGLWPKPQPVETAVVGRGDVVVTVDEEGMTRVKNRYVISAPVAGHLRRIDWKAGAVVEAGRTPLAVIETSEADFLDARSLAEAEARVHAAEANQAAAAAQWERAETAAKLSGTERERAKQLRAQKVISPQDFDAADLRATIAEQDARAARFAAQVADFELEQARAVLSRGRTGAAAEPLTLTSPVNGRILRVYQESERVVPAGFALMEVGDPTDLEARIEVLSRDGVAIRPGARVMIEQWGGPAPLAGRVRLVEPSAFTKISALGVEEQRVYVVVDFLDPLAQRPTLGDNYRVEGRIVVWEGHEVLRVPSGALFQRGDRWQTFVVEHGRAVLRAVTPGHGNGRETEIRDGLRQGDRVVVYPGDGVADGVRVRPVTVDSR